MVKLLLVGALVLGFSAPLSAQEVEDHTKMLMDHGDGHLMDMAGGMVMGQNTDKLPGGCDSISETKEVTVHAGHKYAEKFPGRMFAFDTQEFHFKPCTKLTVHFINEDSVRHQWMMHDLPKYLYPKGMFHLEVTGPAKISGTLILPSADKTYLVHCDIAQHMEKGMKAQVKVGKGSGDLPSIPGVTAYLVPDDYNADLKTLVTKKAAEPPMPPVAFPKEPPPLTPMVPAPSVQPAAPKSEEPFISGLTVIGLAIGLLLAPFLARKFKGMTVSESITYIFGLLRSLFELIAGLITKLFKLILSNKSKLLPRN
ncbi:MAG: copper oxidase [Gammaproteobacteria bacterium]